jgi:hypothetical protein
MSSNPADLRTPTLPKDCGLAIALPLTKEEFRLDATENRKDHDYAPRQANENTWESYWQEHIKSASDIALELIQIAQNLGIEVRESAKLNDLTELFKTRTVVTIIAHWCGHNLARNDLLGSPENFVDKILASHENDFIASMLRSQIQVSKLEEIQSASNTEQSRKDLIEALNTALDSSLLQPPDLYPNMVELPVVNRALLDHWAGACLKPGNLMELRDGLHSVLDVAHQIPKNFSGIIHLVMCQSTYLGNQIRQNYPNRRVIMSPGGIHPIPNMLILKLLYLQLSRGIYNYSEVLSRIHSSL